MRDKLKMSRRQQYLLSVTSSLDRTMFSKRRSATGTDLRLCTLMVMIGLIVHVFGICCELTTLASASRVYVDSNDNAYRGLVIAISPKIKPHHGKVLIPNLEVSKHLIGGKLLWYYYTCLAIFKRLFSPSFMVLCYTEVK